MEKMLKFLDNVIWKTNKKYNVEVAAEIRKLKDTRNTLRGLFYAYEDFEEYGEAFELPNTARTLTER